MRVNLRESHHGIETEVICGLKRRDKKLSSKWLYDERGSNLFEQICRTREYYLSRAEIQILARRAPELSRAIGESCLLIELGSGSGLKTEILLNHLQRPAAYVPVDISQTQLAKSSARMKEKYPSISIMPLCVDYAAPFSVPRGAQARGAKVFFFPGSTIGNFEPSEAIEFLRRLRHLSDSHSLLVIGADLKKDPSVLHAAYNDREGITAEFNRNVLLRINRELGADFDLENFAHYAFYNPRAGRMEMHLASLCDQRVNILDDEIRFRDGESILTEHSYKYTPEEFSEMLCSAGYDPREIWFDELGLFSVYFCSSADQL